MQDVRAMLADHLDTIPMVRAMQVGLGDIEPARLVLHAPLAANLNDKGCAFGGSLVSLMTLAGWAWVTTRLHAAGFEGCEVFVADSQVQYLAPLWDDLFPTEQARIVRLLVQRIDLSPDDMRVRLRADGLQTLVEELRLRVAA